MSVVMQGGWLFGDGDYAHCFVYCFEWNGRTLSMNEAMEKATVLIERIYEDHKIDRKFNWDSDETWVVIIPAYDGIQAEGILGSKFDTLIDA